MAEVVNMPLLSDTMEEGTVAKWNKKVGDQIEEGDILAEIETDKATMEFESFYDGTLLYIAVEEGDSAPVDSPLVIIGDKDENIDDLIKKIKNGGDDKKEDHQDSPEDGKEEKTSADDSDSSDTKNKKNTDGNDDEGGNDGEIPEGVEIVNMPLLSDTMEEGTISAWDKKEGDEVEEGEILAEIETDKATMEFESFYNGILLHIFVKEGESIAVDEPIAMIGPKGTDVDKVLTAIKNKGSKKKSGQKTAEKEPKDSKKDQGQKGEKENDNKEEAQEKTSKNTPPQNGRIFASPLARKMAEDKGINLADVNGSGPNHRIVKKDIENYKPSENAKATAEKATGTQVYTPVGEESWEEVKNSQMRKTIAKRLTESQFSAPHFYLTIEVDMDNAIASRKSINNIPDTKISFNDLVIKASAMALRKHPQVNSQWEDKVTKIAKHIHIGVAVAVEDGLVVPVLRFTDQQSLTQIGANVKELAGKAHNKKIQPDEMQGSTFTVSNLGMFGIQEFTSIINQPNSCILSVGAIEEKPVVREGEIKVGHTMKLTLACDHRTVDGATGAKFLQTLKIYLENPVTMLA